MSQRLESELDAAQIRDPQLRRDYAHCRGLAADHGRTYFLATRFLSAGDRPGVHALYGFARTADDIVDDPSPAVDTAERTRKLELFAADMQASDPAEPSVRAVLDTSRRYDLPPKLFEDFLGSMRMDLHTTTYDTFEDLQTYVYGSAAVIGLMVTPILGTVTPFEQAAPFAADLGVAFQLTNFIRDVGEDARLGRIYLPQDSLAAFGVEPASLSRGVVDNGIRNLLAFEIDRTRSIYRRAEPGIDLLSPRARHCVRTAFDLYGRILDRIEAADYQIFDERIRVSRLTRLRLAATAVGRMSRDRASSRPGSKGYQSV